MNKNITPPDPPGITTTEGPPSPREARIGLERMPVSILDDIEALIAEIHRDLDRTPSDQGPYMLILRLAHIVRALAREVEGGPELVPGVGRAL